MALRRTVSALAPSRSHYDYVIVGAGSAGCVIAHRLVRRGARVLLLENGPDDRGSWDWWKISMPAALTFNIGTKKYNWDFWTTPQRHMDGRKLHQPRGRTLGGSSSINAMAYVRGNALDYERWASEVGEGGETWNYRHVLPYFRRAQCHQEGASAYRGGEGPLSVCRKRSPAVLDVNESFIQAGVQAGYPRTEDMNGFQQEGFGFMDMTVAPDGSRASASAGYLRPLLRPKNAEDRDAGARLEVATKRTAVRLLFEGQRAVGVETIGARSGSGVEQHIAKEEVILCSGAVGSPQLLNLSGIGDAAELEALGIEVRQHLPEVGKNLQDHLEFYVQYLSEPPSLYPYAATFGGLGMLSKYAFRRPDHAVKSGIQWLLQGAGIGASNHFEVGGFIRSKPGVPHPDIQYHFIPAIVTGQLDILAAHGFQAHCGTMRPTSRGTVRLSSADPHAEILIDPNFLATPKDVEDMRAGLRLTVEILQQPALADSVKHRFSPASDFDIEDDTAVDAWIRQNSHSGYHLSCTCAMGRVVDAEGRVYGFEGLRVADASIMPSMTSGNLNAPTIMLAEKIADKISGVELPPDDDSVTWYQPADWATAQR